MGDSVHEVGRRAYAAIVNGASSAAVCRLCYGEKLLPKRDGFLAGNFISNANSASV